MRRRSSILGFTLVELLVVVAVIIVLIGLLIPTLGAAKETARRAVCAANLQQVGIAIHAYASEWNFTIPYGPKAPPVLTASDLYPATGTPTSLLSLMNGAPVGLGLLVSDKFAACNQLAKQPRALFCSSADQPEDAAAQLALVGVHQAQCSYYYRHGSNTQASDPPGPAPTSAYIRIDNLGLNSTGQPMGALAIDAQLLAPPGFAQFGVTQSTHHQQKAVNILFADGHVVTQPNVNARFTVDLNDPNVFADTFARIVAVFESADSLP